MKFIESVRKTFKTKPMRQAGWIIAGCGVLTLIGAPSARGQLGIDIAAVLAELHVVNSTMQAVMGAPMQAIQQVNQQMSDFNQNTVYPASGTTAAQGTATQALAQSQQSQQTVSTPISGAQLGVDQQLESTMLSGDPNDVSGLSAQYQQTYGVLPAATGAPVQSITAVDMGDAVAQESMKKAIELDALAAREMEVSQQLLTQLQTTAPGNAPIISAQAAAWLVQAHGYSQGALAQVLRAQSAALGYEGSELKQGSTANQKVSGAVSALSAVANP